MRNVRFILSVIFFAPSAFAQYYVMPVTAPVLDPTQRTHVIVAGRGNDLGTAPQIAAAAKAKKLVATYPGEQVLVIVTQETDPAGNARALRNLGFRYISHKTATLDARQLMDELVPLLRIASFNVFGHSGIVPGVYLDRIPGTERDVRWLDTDAETPRLCGHFTPDAYAVFNGCNLGHVGAPAIAKLWQIPVAGALTSTHFEGMAADGRFYWADTPVFAGPGCESGQCYRMRPDNSDYTGSLGHYRVGLGFYKFFCPGIAPDACQRAMAAQIASAIVTPALTPRPSFDDFARAAREWMCPSAKRIGDPTQDECLDRLAHLNGADLKELEYTPFGGSSLACSFNGCYEEPACSAPGRARDACASAGRTLGHSTTFVKEYLNYLKGYALLFGCDDQASGPDARPNLADVCAGRIDKVTASEFLPASRQF